MNYMKECSIKYASTSRNLNLRFATKCDSNQPAQLQRLAEISLVANLDIMLSNKRIIYLTPVETQLLQYNLP